MQPSHRDNEGRDFHPRNRLVFGDQLAIEEGENRDILDAVQRLQGRHVHLEDSVDCRAQSRLAFNRFMPRDPRPGHDLRQRSRRLVLVQIAGFHADHVQLIDPARSDDRPIVTRKNPTLVQQRPVLAIGAHQRLRQDCAVDCLGG